MTAAQPQSKERQAARRQIMDMAQMYSFVTKMDIYRAVCICRRKLLVSDDTLIDAGFNPVPNRRERYN